MFGLFRHLAAGDCAIFFRHPGPLFFDFWSGLSGNDLYVNVILPLDNCQHHGHLGSNAS